MENQFSNFFLVKAELELEISWLGTRTVHIPFKGTSNYWQSVFFGKWYELGVVEILIKVKRIRFP